MDCMIVAESFKRHFNFLQQTQKRDFE